MQSSYYIKRSAKEAHSREDVTCRKRPHSALACVMAHALFILRYIGERYIKYDTGRDGERYEEEKMVKVYVYCVTASYFLGCVFFVAGYWK